MTEKLKETIKEEIIKLPKEMREAINSFNWVKITEEIGKKYLLNDSEISSFQAETLLVLLTIEDGYSYTLNIKNNVGVSGETAEKIAGDAFKKIFTPIGDMIEENIKKSEKDFRADAVQNLDFIMSGGNYAVFLQKEYGEEKDHDKIGETSHILGASNILEIKDRLIN